jgi:hypothetical protein
MAAVGQFEEMLVGRIRVGLGARRVARIVGGRRQDAGGLFSRVQRRQIGWRKLRRTGARGGRTGGRCICGCARRHVLRILHQLGSIRLLARGDEADCLQIFAAFVQILLACGIAVDLEQKGADVGILVARELARLVLGHGGADTVEQVAHRQPNPVGGEFRAGEGRGLAIALGGRAVTGRAIGGELGLAAGGLGLGIDAAERGGGGLRQGRLHHGRAACRSRQAKSSRQQGDPVAHEFWSVPKV